MGEKEEKFRKKLSPMNYETVVETFMPHKERIIIDHPIHPERTIEEAELEEEYNRVYKKYMGDESR